MKKIEEIKPIIENILYDFTEQELIDTFKTASINDILEKSLLYFSKFIKQINFQVKYYDIKENEEFSNFIADIFAEIWNENFTSYTLQDRVFILKNYKGFGSVSIEKQGVIASRIKKYPLIYVDGDLCWGYKNGSSVVRTAILLLNEVIYNYDVENEIYEKMASDFANEVLSIFQQNAPARLEERKIIAWIDKYKESHSVSTGENIVKKVCTELEITQKELAEELGVDDGTVRKWSSAGKAPDMAERFMICLLENKKLKSDFEILRKAHKIIAGE